MNIRMKWFYRLGFLLLLFVVIFVFWNLQPLWLPIFLVMVKVFIPFFIGGFITYLLHPIVEKLHNTGFHRGIAVVVIYLLFFGSIGFSVYKAFPSFVHQLKDLSENIPVFADKYRDSIEWIQARTNEWPAGVQKKVEEGIIKTEQYISTLLSSILDGLVQTMNAAIWLAIIPFIAFYMLKDFNLMKKVVWYLTPRKFRKKGMLFLRDVDHSLGSYIRGQLLVCVIIGFLSFLFFLFAGIKYSLLLGLIVGITNVIPYFGPVFGAIPAIIIASTMSVNKVIFVFIIIVLLQFLEGNILSPYIVGRSLHMHPLLIMFALLLGGEFAGLIGLILAIPILAVLKVAAIHARSHFRKSVNLVDKH